MNRSSLPQPTRRPLRCAFLALSLAGLSATSAVAAPIIARFSDGNSTSQVDAWTGMAGNGWVSAWGSTANANTTVTGTAISTNPFSDGGNYLQTTVTNNHASANRSGSVSRRYGSTDEIKLNEAHTISFEYRLDTLQADIYRLYLFDSTERTISPEGAGNTTTWLIRGNPTGSWVVHNGTSTVNTGMALDEHQVYRFTIAVSPAAIAAESTYRVTIENLSDPDLAIYTSGDLLFYSPQTSVGGFLNFQLGMPFGKAGTFSIDNIAVVPEGSTVAMAGAGMALFAFLNRSRLRKKMLQP